MHVWEVMGGRRLFTLPEHRDGANHAVFSPDGRMIATVDGVAGVRLWDRETHKLIGHRRSPKLQNINCLAWFPDSRYLAAAGEPGTHVMVCGVDEPEPRSLATDHADEVNAMSFVPAGGCLPQRPPTGLCEFGPPTTAWHRRRCTPSSRMLPACDSRPTASTWPRQEFGSPAVKVWQVSDWRLVKEFDTGTSHVGGIALLPDHGDLMCGDALGTLRHWNWGQGRLKCSRRTRQGRICALARAARRLRRHRTRRARYAFGIRNRPSRPSIYLHTG